MYKNRMALARKNTRRMVARVIVAIIGLVIALYYLIQMISTPIFASNARVWANVAYLVMFLVGALIFYLGAFSDFDRSEHERFLR